MSKNVKLGLQFRYQNGEVQVNHNWFLGYTKDEDGHLIIDPEQAEIVKRIYREYLEGKSLMQIARGLMADGIHTAADKPTWRPEGVRKILTNEKYMGDALLQKTYTVDVLTKKRVTNNGIVPQYYVENNHEAIIPRDLFMQVQEEMLREQTSTVVLTERKEFIVVSMLFQALSIAQSVVTSIAELLGITEVSTLLYGDVVQGWNMAHQDVMLLQLGKRNFKRL